MHVFVCISNKQRNSFLCNLRRRQSSIQIQHPAMRFYSCPVVFVVCNRLLASCWFCRLFIVTWIAPLELFFFFHCIAMNDVHKVFYYEKKIYVCIILALFATKIGCNDPKRVALHFKILGISTKYISIGQLYWHRSTSSKKTAVR